MTTPFELLSGALRYQILHTLGWMSLRKVQEASIEAIVSEANCVILAPTAGGKTESAFFPLLSRMETDDWRPISVLYLSPIRALLNNQEDRIAHYAGFVGRRVFKWHGDVDAGPRREMIREPADILLTTPESLEAMLMSARVPAGELFAGLRAVVIDEVHAFAADDRGAHLAAVLERLCRHAGRDVQRIGLSATVGNPDEILRWIAGSSKRPGIVVDPGGARAQPDLVVDHVGDLTNASQVIAALHRGQKRLVFVDSRRQAEDLAKQLVGRDVDAHVTHGSLSAPERRDAERAFTEGRDCVIVATSALELGIDVGDLDQVLQIDAPSSVASFLQRMGRTGRRDQATPNCTFLCTKDATVLQAAALVQLQRDGWVEDVRPSRRASHVYAHQVMALAIQEGGVERGAIDAWLTGATPFADLTSEDRESVVAHMLSTGILADHGGGRLWLGEEGERVYGRANFRALYAVFESPRLITVLADAYEVGTIDANFLESIDEADAPATFTLGGKSWLVVHIDWKRGKCIVRPSPEGRPARWSGVPRFLSYDVCQTMRELLVVDAVDPSWSKRASATMELLRAEHAFLRDERAPRIERKDEITWWTFAGGAANLLLARMIEEALGAKAIARNTNIKLIDGAGKSRAALDELVARWRSEARPTDDDALRVALAVKRGRLSKFEPCLPEPLLRALAARTTLDVGGARAALTQTEGTDGRGAAPT